MKDTSMLQAIIENQVFIKKELGTKLDKLEKKIDRLDKKLTYRIDSLGKQLAILDDDAPTREEFDNLESQVVKNKKAIISLSS